MEKKINFIIKKGVYCSWCAGLMEKTLNQHFAFKEMEIDVIKGRVHLVAYKRINPEKIILFLKKKGYQLVEEREGN